MCLLSAIVITCVSSFFMYHSDAAYSFSKLKKKLKKIRPKVVMRNLKLPREDMKELFM